MLIVALPDDLFVDVAAIHIAEVKLLFVINLAAHRQSAVQVIARRYQVAALDLDLASDIEGFEIEILVTATRTKADRLTRVPFGCVNLADLQLGIGKIR